MTTVERWSGRETRALRLAMRLSSRDFAARLGVNERTVTNWETRREKVCPRPEMQDALDTTLRRASDEVRARFKSLLEVPDQPATPLPDATPGSDDGSASIEADTVAPGPAGWQAIGPGDQEVRPVPTRREVFGYLGAGLTATGTRPAAIGPQWSELPRVMHALAVTERANVADPSLTALEDLNVLVEHYKRTFRSTSPRTLYGEILSVRIHAGSLLDHVSPSASRADLTLAVGWLSNLLALVTHDLDNRAAALVWCADAERCSQRAGYSELAGWAAQTRVLMSFYDGRANDAVCQAQRGQKLAPLGTALHAKLLAHEMRAWALLGDADKVSSTRRRAEKAIAKLPANAATCGTFSISLADDPPYTATSLLLLGRLQESVDATHRVIETFYGPQHAGGLHEHPSGFARTYLVLALALAGIGRLDEAYVAGSAALDAPRLVWPVSVLARKLDRTLMREFPNTPESRDYHERCTAALPPGRPTDRP